MSSLCELSRFTRAVITSIDLQGEDALRVKSLGLCVGRNIELLQTGDPLMVRVAGARIGISRRLATAIVTSPLPDS